MKTRKTSYIFMILLVLAVLVAFGSLYKMDNKYSQVQPAGHNGVLSICKSDLEKPLFLIDGWMLSVDGGKPFETFIGQYSDFSFAPSGHSPFGKGIYTLRIECEEPDQVLTLELPEIFTEYKLYINGKEISSTCDGPVVSFLADDSAELKLVTENYSHYYSGLYYPPALGTSQLINRMHFFKMFIYSFSCISAMILAILSVLMWLFRERNRLFCHFGFLCLATMLSCMHPIIWQMGCSSDLTYAIEDASRIWLWTEAVAVAACASEIIENRIVRAILWIMYLSSAAIMFMVCIAIPSAPSLIHPYGLFINAVVIFAWIVLSVITGIGINSTNDIRGYFLLAGCCTMGISVLGNLLDNNMFEPVYTMWQTEWSALLLVFMYGIVVISYSAKALKENREMKAHLEDMVAERSAELETIIEERKRFFSDMAHNLKSPIANIHGFISLIQQHQVGTDDELLGYIALIKDQNIEMQKRVQALNALNDFDRIDAPRVRIRVASLMKKIDDYNRPAAEVHGVYLVVNIPDSTAEVFVQEEKILIMFENLIENALSFTPADGKVTVSAEIEYEYAVFTVSDTGSGIDENILPHIFDRFYVGRENKEDGSGLGLYIVKLTAEECGGTIDVKSEKGKGTSFTIKIPLAK